MQKLLTLLGILAAALVAHPARAQRVDSGAPFASSRTSLSAACPSSCATLGVSGYGTTGIQITGSWTGTLTFTGSIDGSTFTALNCTAPNSTSPATSTTANGTWTCDVGGLATVEVGFSPYTSGTATVSLQASAGSSARGQAPAGAGGTASAFGSAFPANGTAAGFKDSSGLSMAAGNLDAGGRIIVDCGAGCSGASDTVGSTTALNALNVAATVTLSTEGGAGLLLAAGTLIGTIVPELSFDGGTTWVVTLFFNPVDQTTASSIVFGSSNTVTTRSILVAAGASTARVRVSAFTSGTANATLRATLNGSGNYTTLSAGSTVTATGNVASGSADAGNPLKIGGVFNTTQPTVTTGQRVDAQSTARGAVIVATGADTFHATVDNPSANNTEAATLSASQTSVSYVDSTLFAFDGTTNSRLRSRAALIGSSDVGLVTRPFLPSDGTNTMPAMDAAARVGFVRQSDGTNSAILDPCETNTQSVKVVNISTAGTTLLVAAVSAKHTFFCGLNLVAGAADNVALIEGTHTTTDCDTGAAGMNGGTTAASGWNFAANGGIALPAGKVAHLQTAGTNVQVCVVTSAAAQLSGTIKYVQQ